jgi:hypothetical protein
MACLSLFLTLQIIAVDFASPDPALQHSIPLCVTRDPTMPRLNKREKQLQELLSTALQRKLELLRYFIPTL